MSEIKRLVQFKDRSDNGTNIYPYVKHYSVIDSSDNELDEYISELNINQILGDQTIKTLSGAVSAFNSNDLFENYRHSGIKITFKNASGFAETHICKDEANIGSVSGWEKIIDYSEVAVERGSGTNSTKQRGSDSSATGKYSHAEGYKTDARGEYSHTEGYTTIVDASARGGHAEGMSTYVGGAWGAHAEGSQSRAEGDYSHAEGNDAQALASCVHAEGSATRGRGYNSHVEGYNSETGGTATSNTKSAGTQTGAGAYAHAEGNATIAKGVSSHAEGEKTFASGKASHAEGKSKATGDYSHSEGNGTASANYSHAEGGSTASGNQSHAEGNNCTASSNNAHAEGAGSTASGVASHAEGTSIASGQRSHSEGHSTKSDGEDSHAEGYNSETGGTAEANEKTAGTLETSGAYAHAEGNSTIAKGVSSHSEGTKTFAVGISSHAEGDTTQAIGPASHSEGFDTVAEGEASHAEGDFTEAYGDASHAEGDNTVANGYASHAEGNNNVANGENSHAEGNQCITATGATNSHAEGWGTETGGTAATNTKSAGTLETSGAYAHAEGNATIAKGVSSHSEGTKTISGGKSSHAEGNTTSAAGENSHSEGYFTYAIGTNAHAEGRSRVKVTETVATGSDASILAAWDAATNKFSLAKGHSSHLEGYNNLTLGNYSHAEGAGTNAIGAQSHVEGNFTKALNDYEHAEGSFNISIPNVTRHTVGMGSTLNDKKNAHVITVDGKHYIPGIGGFLGTEANPSDLYSKTDLATYINNISRGTGPMNVYGTFDSTRFDFYNGHIIIQPPYPGAEQSHRTDFTISGKSDLYNFYYLAMQSIGQPILTPEEEDYSNIYNALVLYLGTATIDYSPIQASLPPSYIPRSLHTLYKCEHYEYNMADKLGNLRFGRYYFEEDTIKHDSYIVYLYFYGATPELEFVFDSYH